MSLLEPLPKLKLRQQFGQLIEICEGALLHLLAHGFVALALVFGWVPGAAPDFDGRFAVVFGERDIAEDFEGMSGTKGARTVLPCASENDSRKTRRSIGTISR